MPNMSQTEKLKRYFEERRTVMDVLCNDETLHRQLTGATAMISQCISRKNKILIAGNGGSASQSQHLCAELMGRMKRKRSPFQAVALTSDTALLTCIANDFGYERIFSRQIEGIGLPGDVFIAFTTSGKSRNVLEALLECKSRSIGTIVFTGTRIDSISRLSDVLIQIPHDDTAIIQECHLQLIHIMCEIVENALTEWDDDPWGQVLKMSEQGFQTLLLDRDGVMNYIKPNGYIQHPSEFVLREDFAKHIKSLSDAFDLIFVVTNQKGVGKGKMSITDLESVNKRLIEEIEANGGRIDKIYFSTSPDNNHPDNKPNTGMSQSIKGDYPEVDFSKAVVVGDSASDFLFADNLKSRFIYVRTR